MDSDPWADTAATPTLPGEPEKSAHSPLEGSEAVAEHDPSGDVTADPEASSAGFEPAAEEDDGFDDFDDFDEPASAAGPSLDSFGQAEGGGDDGFGDFGDFEEGDFADDTREQAMDEGGVLGGSVMAEPEAVQERWHALNLRPFPPRSEVVDQLIDLLSPVCGDSEYLTDEQPRMVGGLSQVLVAESSRDAYAQLTTAPMLKPLDWTRSRVRREHLISMGVPVNLDEVDSHRLSALPPLRITTGAAHQPRRADTVDVDSNGRYTSAQKGKGRETSTDGNAPVSAGPNGRSTANGNSKYGLGTRPELDMARAEEYCGLEEDQLSLLSVAKLRQLQSDLSGTSAQASALLTWLLQFKDAQTQDAATYNGIISELIANAAKAKSAQATGGGVFRRASAKRPQSVSGTVTPRRTGSPGMW
ncbi:hypothetical protein IAU60_000104 [Kwoniella sp. DSM 27419]